MWLVLPVSIYVAVQVFSALHGVNQQGASGPGSAPSTITQANEPPPSPAQEAGHVQYETVEQYEHDGQTYLRTVDYPSLEAFNRAHGKEGGLAGTSDHQARRNGGPH